jgi:hypothetical protein
VVHTVGPQRSYWLDATDSYQRGPLDEIYFPALGRALVVRPGGHELDRVAGSGLNACRTEITETFLLDDYRGGAVLNVVSHYHGRDAESVRSYFADVSRESIERGCLDHYATDYPSIEVLAPIAFEDDEARNRVTVRESYRIRDLWKPRESAGDQVEASFYARSLDAEIRKPSNRIRTMPFGIDHPRRIDQTIELCFPTRLSFAEDDVRIENPAFRFILAIRPQGRTVVLHYKYRSLDHCVAPGALDRYFEDVNKAKNRTGYTVWIPTRYQESPPPDSMAPSAEAPLVLNWPVILITLLVFLLSAVGAVFVARWNPPFTPPYPDHGAPVGIGGWLILPAIGLVVGPFFMLSDLRFLVFEEANLPVWTALTTPGADAYHPLWMPTLLLDIALRTALLVFDLLLIVLFFRKKHTLPRLMIIYLVANFVTAALVMLLINRIPDLEKGGYQVSRIAVFRTGAVCLVWGSYFSLSRRVRATFVRGRPG